MVEGIKMYIDRSLIKKYADELVKDGDMQETLVKKIDYEKVKRKVEKALFPDEEGVGSAIREVLTELYIDGQEEDEEKEE